MWIFKWNYWLSAAVVKHFESHLSEHFERDSFWETLFFRAYPFSRNDDPEYDPFGPYERCGWAVWWNWFLVLLPCTKQSNFRPILSLARPPRTREDEYNDAPPHELWRGKIWIRSGALNIATLRDTLWEIHFEGHVFEGHVFEFWILRVMFLNCERHTLRDTVWGSCFWGSCFWILNFDGHVFEF